MPFFCFSINEVNPSFKKFNIIANTIYYSKNTQLWKLLNKQDKLIINFLKYKERSKVNKIGKKILFCLPPSIGLGDSIEYASSIRQISENNYFDELAIAFNGNYNFLFHDYFNLTKTYPYIIKKSEMEKFDTVFHVSLELKSLKNQKYFRSNIFYEFNKYFNIQHIKNTKTKLNKKNDIKKISIFPLSRSPIRTLPVKILNEIINNLKDNYYIEVCLDNNSEISNFIYNNINLKNISIVDPRDGMHLFSLIKNIEYGLFMDSGPLHVAKMFNKRGMLLETSVSSDILLDNYSLIKGIKNKFSSNFCKAPCGLTDIFNFNNNFGCYDSLEIESKKFHSNNFKNMTSRGVKSNYLKKVLKPVACVTSLNVQAILNALKKDLSL